jgi:sporulation protein yunB
MKQVNFMKKRLLWIITAVLLVIVCLSVFFIQNIEQQLLTNARAIITARVNLIMNECINSALMATVLSGDLVEYVTDSSVLYLQANSLVLNQLAAAACQAVQARLDDMCSIGVSLPLGSALGVDLFAGSGPRINVNVALSGNVTNDYKSTFESAGINQTKHSIILVLAVNISVFLSSKSNTFSVENSVAIFEGIIVGTVPNYYLQTDRISWDLIP